MNKEFVNFGHRVDLADLSDTKFDFKCELEKDDHNYFDYNLKALVNDYLYNRSMTRTDVKYLRENCKRILKATEEAI
jgi:hypothetical protein